MPSNRIVSRTEQAFVYITTYKAAAVICITLSKKLVFFAIMTGLFALVSTGYISYEYSKNVITATVQNQIESESGTHGAALRALLESSIARNEMLAGDPDTRRLVTEHGPLRDGESAAWLEAHRSGFLERIYDFGREAEYGMALSDVSILSSGGEQVFALRPGGGTAPADGAYLEMLGAEGGGTFVRFEEGVDGGPVLATVSRVPAGDGGPAGALISRAPAHAINDLLASSGLGGSGEVYMVDLDGQMVSRSKFADGATFGTTVDSEAVAKCQEDGSGHSGVYAGHTGREVYGSAYCARDLGIVLLAEVDSGTVKAPLAELRNQMLQAGSAIVVGLGGVAVLAARTLSRPIVRLRKMAGEVAGGNFDVRSSVGGGDEIGELAGEFDIMARRLKESMASITEKEDVIRRQEGVLLQFSNHSEKYGVGMIDIIGSTKACAQMSDAQMGEFYRIFINSMGHVIQKYEGTVIKNVGDALLFCFSIYGHDRRQILKKCIDCCTNMCEIHDAVARKLSRADLPPIDYRISVTYGTVRIAKSSTSLVEDIFGATVNQCAKINRSAPANGVIVGERFYEEAKDFEEYRFRKVQKDAILADHGYTGYIVTRDGAGG